MRFSLKCIKDYVGIEPDPRDYADKMTMSGSKVEAVIVPGAEITGVVVGKVDEIWRHENSDHLWVCEVNIGSADKLQIVTGAQNVRKGDIVPVATHGATLPGGIKIKNSKLRGVPSQGMLCSLSELGLTKHDFPYASEDGILILQEAKLGEDIRKVVGLDDTIFEFEITSNRPDCLSLIGLARETAATYRCGFSTKQPFVKNESGDISSMLKITVKEPELCPRYVAKAVKNVKVAPSPLWLRERLRTLGVRPINNIVDITNLVMLEYGQPMHAFDIDYIHGGEIVVRRANEGEVIRTLDSQQRKLTSDMLVIADTERAIAVAGVMGGENSEITDSTTTVIFESANFNGLSVRMTSKKLGLRTEASSRFEKGLDPEISLKAALRACELVELLGCGEVVGGEIDVYRQKPSVRRLPLDDGWINGFLATNISRKEMEDILASLEFKICPDGTVEVPSFRTDVEGSADLAEEIARIYGYDKIPATIPSSAMLHGGLTRRQKLVKQVNDLLLAMGYDEISTYSFISPKDYEKIALPADSPLRNSVVISNPLGEDTSIMRTTILPSFLETLSRNFGYRNKDVSLFEVGAVYIPNADRNELPIEKQVVVMGGYEKEDFYTLKGTVERLCRSLRAPKPKFTALRDNPTFHPGRTASISIDEKELGVIGEIHPMVAKNYEIETKAYVAMLDLDTLLEAVCCEVQYVSLPRFPSSLRDLAFVCDDNIEYSEIVELIKKAGGRYLSEVKLFDIYKGKQIPEGKKSMAFSLVFRAPERTLTDEEINASVNEIVNTLESNLRISLRK